MVKNTSEQCQCAARQMDGETKATLVLDALRKNKPITSLSSVYNVSRKFIHKQKNKAVSLINKVFSDSDEKSGDEKNIVSSTCYKIMVKTIYACLNAELSQ